MIKSRCSAPGERTRILLVEDHDLVRLLLEDYLTVLGYQVFSLADGSDFFLSLVQFDPDVVLLDLKLPDVSGFTLLEQLQQQPRFWSVPIVVVTAYAFASDRRKAISLGARRYLVKPIKMDYLLETIEEVCHERV